MSAHPGAIECAQRGTLFLDEIGEMPVHMQAKLLRVLETSEVQRLGSREHKQIDFRLVTATNRNLEQAVKDGRFREDLYYRVHVYPVHVPPLRERPDDIPRLVHHHLSVIGLREHQQALRITQTALDKRLLGSVKDQHVKLERLAGLAKGRARTGHADPAFRKEPSAPRAPLVRRRHGRNDSLRRREGSHRTSRP